MKLTHQIALAFAGLALVIALSTTISFYYLEKIGFYQTQFEKEWKEYKRMVLTEDSLNELSVSINAWEAGMIPTTTLKQKAKKIIASLSSWKEDVFTDESDLEPSDEDEQETKIFSDAKQAYLRLIHIINSLPKQPTSKVSAALIDSLDRLKEMTLPLRQEYFKSLQMDLDNVRKFQNNAQRDSIIFIFIIGFLVVGISFYSVHVLHHQALKLIEQERQMISVTLVKNLAHEIRNPLGIIKSAASVIAKRSNKEIAALADDISLEVIRVDELLTDLLHLRQTSNLPMLPTNIAALTAKTAELFAPKMQMAELKLTVLNEAGDTLCPCRQDAIKQVLINLLLNAIEASSKDSVIEIRTALHQYEYMIQVLDHGHGITPKEEEKIFDLMYSTKPYGFGIGLTVVKRIIQDHHGRIEVTRQYPKGTAFTIFLPMKV